LRWPMPSSTRAMKKSLRPKRLSFNVVETEGQ
jgi:hypothetical protein